QPGTPGPRTSWPPAPGCRAADPAVSHAASSPAPNDGSATDPGLHRRIGDRCLPDGRAGGIKVAADEFALTRPVLLDILQRSGDECIRTATGQVAAGIDRKPRPHACQPCREYLQPVEVDLDRAHRRLLTVRELVEDECRRRS